MYQIIVEKEDFLRFQLFTASKSKRIRKKRITSWILMTSSFLCLGLVFGDDVDKFLAYYFLTVSIISLFFYPYYTRWKYKKHFQKHIEENYNNKMGLPSEISFDQEYLITKDKTSEGRIKLTEIELINEIKEDLFIKFYTGETLIVPARNPDFESFKSELASTLPDPKIQWNKEYNWRWK
ncbi:MAG: hypothetical protein IPH88_10345 [Bacteroidales bacterium]|nr:hypothetical protein [Bacteroidales bacterium]